MSKTAWTLLLLSSAGFATDKPTPPTDDVQTQEQHQSQSVSATAAPVVTAGGGGGASQSLSMEGDRSSTLAIARGAPIPAVCPDGLVPGGRFKRGGDYLLFALSAVCVPPSEAQHAAIAEARAHEVELARLAVEAAKAEADRDRAAAERIRAESQCDVCSGGARK